VSDRCLAVSWAFQRAAADLNACSRDDDCEVVVAADPVGPGWIALGREWRKTSAAENYAQLGEVCGDVDTFGVLPTARCLRGSCWLSRAVGVPFWSASP
jgi:hypothetical protein